MRLSQGLFALGACKDPLFFSHELLEQGTMLHSFSSSILRTYQDIRKAIEFYESNQHILNLLNHKIHFQEELVMSHASVVSSLIHSTQVVLEIPELNSVAQCKLLDHIAYKFRQQSDSLEEIDNMHTGPYELCIALQTGENCLKRVHRNLLDMTQ